MLIALGAHVLGIALSQAISGVLMPGTSQAEAARAYLGSVRPWFNAFVFPLATVASLAILLPLIEREWRGRGDTDDSRLRRAVLLAPRRLALIGFLPWLASMVVYPLLVHFDCVQCGGFGGDLASPYVITPFMSGALASITSYLGCEWVLRSQVSPRLFPEGNIAAGVNVRPVGVQMRFFLLLFAIGFTPMFTVVGTLNATEARLAAGQAPAVVVGELAASINTLATLFFLVGSGMAALFARSLTRPLQSMASTVKRVHDGDLDARVPVSSNDEIDILAAGINSLVATMSERDRILTTFGRVVDPDVRDRLLSGRASAEGERRDAVILFADMRGFTTLSERRQPDEVVALLNALFTTMSEEVKRRGGFVDKFVGDAMLAVFGLFDEPGQGGRVDAASAAVDCALAIRSRLDGDPAVQVRMAVHGGPVIAATLGARDRYEYTVIGDPVNVAARLVEAAKAYDTDLLVSRKTLDEALDPGSMSGHEAEHETALRGRQATVRACEIRASTPGGGC